MSEPNHIRYSVITTSDQLHEACKLLASEEALGLDTETTGFDPYSGTLRLLQLASPSHTFVIDMHSFANDHSNLFDPLRKILSSPAQLKVLHNAKFDYKFILKFLNVELENIFDTMLASQMLDFFGKHSLDVVADRYLNVDVDKTLQKSNWSGPLSMAQLEYAARDAEVTLSLKPILEQLLIKDNLANIAQLEFDCVKEVANMETTGFAVDRKRFEDLISGIEQRRDVFASELITYLQPGISQMSLFDDARQSINLNSPAQLTEAFKKIGIHLPASTRSYLLVPLAEEHEAIRLLLEYRAMQKLATSFGRNLLDLSKRTGRIHASFRQIGAETGRFSCESPNLQNLPAEQKFRSVFRAPHGRSIITADYSQIELRILAEVSGDEGFRSAFEAGIDLHRATAANIFKSSIELVTPQMREFAKRMNFGVVYGMGAKSLARALKISEYEGREMLDRYFATYPKLDKWLRNAAREALETGQVRTVSGRAIRFNVDTEDPTSKAVIERAARNAPVQGTNADILKNAMVLLGKWLPSMDSSIVNIVHDEIVVEAPENLANEVSQRMVHTMKEAAADYLPNVPVVVEPIIAEAWTKK
jgi:DNA polymerase I